MLPKEKIIFIRANLCLKISPFEPYQILDFSQFQGAKLDEFISKFGKGESGTLAKLWISEEAIRIMTKKERKKKDITLMNGTWQKTQAKS